MLRPRGIAVTPVMEWFCADGAYRDDTHLTEPCTRMLQPSAEQVLR